MRLSAVLAALLLMSVPALAQMGPPGGGGGGPGGLGGAGAPGGTGRPMRPPKPLKRETFDKAVTAMFGKGDMDRNGTITLAELRAVIDARRDALIEARFKRVDADADGSIAAAEFVAWQRQMGSAALSEDQASRRDGEIVPALIEPDLGDEENDVALRRLIDPLDATMLVEVNTNYDSGVTLSELLAYEGSRFGAADSNGDGTISMEEMRLPGPGREAVPGRPGAGPRPAGD